MNGDRRPDLEVIPRDLKRMEKLVASGLDLNPPEGHNDSPLYRTILKMQNPRARMRAVKALIACGAKVEHYASGSGPLFAAVIQVDTEVMELLMRLGANPDEHHDTGEPLYDWAETYYRLDEYGIDPELPENPMPEDYQTEDTWLKYLDRLAIKYHKRRPDHLYLLRKYGARSYSEKHPNKAL